MIIDGYKPQYFLYRAFNADGLLLYVGITSNVPLRVGQHSSSKPWWREVERVVPTTYSDKTSAADAERVAIQTESPRYNLVHTDDYRATTQGRKAVPGPTNPNATTYNVVAERDGRSWFIQVLGIGVVTQGRWAGEVELMARDVIAVTLEVDIEDVQVSIQWKLPENVATHLETSRRLRDKAAWANAQAAEESRLAARALHAQGLGSKEIGVVLGVSRQRAHQLIAAGGTRG